MAMQRTTAGVLAMGSSEIGENGRIEVRGWSDPNVGSPFLVAEELGSVGIGVHASGAPGGLLVRVPEDREGERWMGSGWRHEEGGSGCGYGWARHLA